MAQTKIYPSTQAQVQAVQNTVDEINSKIVTPNYQVKTVTPSDVQQTVQADNGYTALWSVTVEPIAAAMPENLEAFILNSSVEPFSLSLDGVVPAYACYYKKNLKRVYGQITQVGTYAFSDCSLLEAIDLKNTTAIWAYAFYNCSSLKDIDLRSASDLFRNAFEYCSQLNSVDLRNMLQPSNGANSIFSNCTNLKYVDLRHFVRFENANMFSHCSALVLVDATSTAVPIIMPYDEFANTNSTWTLAVADDTVKAAYQSATNWSVRASQIKTIAEIEAEVGMTYDEYYLQCFGHPRFD